MSQKFCVKVENEKQLNVAMEFSSVSDIILARDSFSDCELPKLVDFIKKHKKGAFILMERISRYEEKMEIKNLKFLNSNSAHTKDAIKVKNDLRLSTDKVYEIKNLDGIIIQNLDSFAYMLRAINKSTNPSLKVELNYTMNCYNQETKNLYETLYRGKRKNGNNIPLTFTAPVELNIYEISDVGYDTLILYSYIDTMVSANCLRKNTKKVDDSLCQNRFNFNKTYDYSSYIIDRKGKKLYYKTYCKYCYNKIFNTEPLYLIDKIEELESIYKENLENQLVDRDFKTYSNNFKYRIDFSFENEKEVYDILSLKKPLSFTRGHFKQSIK